MAKKVESLAEAKSHAVAPDLFLRLYREIRACKDAHDETGAALARAKKKAKSEGVDLDALKMLERWTKLDLDEVEVQIAHLLQYAAWIEMPIGAQLDMFGDTADGPKPTPEAAALQREFAVKQSGWETGQTGGLRDANPYQAGTADYVAWDASWINGNRVWLEAQAGIAAEMSPAKSRRTNGGVLEATTA